MNEKADEPAGALAIVVAADRDLGIGKDGTIPWRLPGDMAHFKALTRDTRNPEAPDTVNAVVMGRKTWDSIPPRFRPLARRRNVVISRQPDLELPDGVLLASDLDHAIELAVSPPEGVPGSGTVERIFIIGGGQIYADALTRPQCRTLYLTRIDATFECDVFLPPFERDFERGEILREARENDLDYRIEVWHRKPSP